MINLDITLIGGYGDPPYRFLEEIERSVIPESRLRRDVRNPEKTTPCWIPDRVFAASGMTISFLVSPYPSVLGQTKLTSCNHYCLVLPQLTKDN
jgi:hypothetical protein